MIIVGLTGGIGCGKSAVCRLFSALGTPVVDADEIAHRLSQPGQSIYQAIVHAFGTTYLHSNGELDRRKLRDAVFADPELRSRLEQLSHPLIRSSMLSEAQTYRNSPYCLYAIPLLLEKNWTDMVDRVLVVDCSVSQQISRVVARDRVTSDKVEAILASQLERHERLARANDVIDNSGKERDLEPQVYTLHQRYLELAARQLRN